MKVRDLFERYFQEGFTEEEKKKRSYNEFRDLYCGFIDSVVGDNEAESFCGEDAVKVLENGKKQFACADTLKRLKRLMIRLADYGVMTGELRFNSIKSYEVTLNNVIDSDYYSDEQIALVLENIKHLKYEHLFGFIIHSGCSRAEACGLDHSSLFLEEGQCYVDRLLDSVDSSMKPVFKRRTRGAFRIALNEKAQYHLREQEKLQATYKKRNASSWKNEYDLVFTDGFGNPVQKDMLREDTILISRLTGIRGLTIERLKKMHVELINRNLS